VIGGVLPYLGILLAAIVEGEVAYVGACALVAAGRLDPAAVVLAGATGAAVGDQMYFYLFRGRLARWTARFPSLERKVAPLLDIVKRRATLAVLLIRFAPGLRIALAGACAYVDVPPVKFSVLNGLTALVWAVLLLIVVGWAGPSALAAFGLGGWKGALVIGAIIVLVFALLGRFERRSMGV
jgi:membrane protein DedA with SNARE-associated domain